MNVIEIGRSFTDVALELRVNIAQSVINRTLFTDIEHLSYKWANYRITIIKYNTRNVNINVTQVV